MKTMKFNTVEVSNINSRVNCLKMMTINEQAEMFARLDMNERDNKKLDITLRKINNAFHRYSVDSKEMSLRPLTLKIMSDRIDIYDGESMDIISSLINPTARDVVDEIRQLSSDWKKFMNAQIIMNGVDAFRITSQYDLIPNRNLKVDKMFKTLKIDKNILSVF